LSPSRRFELSSARFLRDEAPLSVSLRKWARQR
jgi:hypothetical protein